MSELMNFSFTISSFLTTKQIDISTGWGGSECKTIQYRVWDKAKQKKQPCFTILKNKWTGNKGLCHSGFHNWKVKCPLNHYSIIIVLLQYLLSDQKSQVCPFWDKTRLSENPYESERESLKSHLVPRPMWGTTLLGQLCATRRCR